MVIGTEEPATVGTTTCGVACVADAAEEALGARCATGTAGALLADDDAGVATDTIACSAGTLVGALPAPEPSETVTCVPDPEWVPALAATLVAPEPPTLAPVDTVPVPPWTVTLVPVDTVVPEPVCTVALPPIAVASPPEPPTVVPTVADTPGAEPEEALAPSPPVAVALPALADTWTPADVVAPVLCTVALPPTATALPPSPPVADPVETVAAAWMGREALVLALPPSPPVAVALPALADTSTFGEGVAERVALTCTTALPPVAVALPPRPPVASPVLADTSIPAAAAGDDVRVGVAGGGAGSVTATETGTGALATPAGVGDSTALSVEPAASAAPGNARPAAIRQPMPIRRVLRIDALSCPQYLTTLH